MPDLFLFPGEEDHLVPAGMLQGEALVRAVMQDLGMPLPEATPVTAYSAEPGQAG